MSFREFIVFFSPTRFEVEVLRLASCCNFWCRKDPFLAVAEHALWHTVKAGWSWIVPGTLETNWLHSIEQSSWVISNENRYLSFLVLFCVTSFSEPSNNMLKLRQGHPSHKVTTPSILGFWEAKDRSAIFMDFFFYRWTLEASEEMGQCCYCWLLKDTKQGLIESPKRRQCISTCIWEGLLPAGQMAYFKLSRTYAIHVLSCSFHWFCPGNPIVLVSLIDLGTRRIVFAPRWGSRLQLPTWKAWENFVMGSGRTGYPSSTSKMGWSKFGTTQLGNWECFNHRSCTHLYICTDNNIYMHVYYTATSNISISTFK